MSHTKEGLVVQDVLEHAKTYIKNDDELQFIEQAYLFAKEKHAGQYRKTGEDYIIHPLNVAMILTTIYADYQTIAAGFLHDVLEDCDCTSEEMQEKFGPEVTKLVQGVTKLSKMKMFELLLLNSQIVCIICEHYGPLRLIGKKLKQKKL